MVYVIRVLIADEVRLFRSGIAALLTGEPDIDLAGEVADGHRMCSSASASPPDIALVDAELPDMDTPTALRALREAAPSAAAIVMATRRRHGDLRRAVTAGAAGFVLKDSSPTELVDAIRRVARGERVIDPEAAYAELGTAPHTPLTRRELDVLLVAAEGATVHEIADRLFLSRGTVRNYLARAVTKIGARTRVEAIAIARDRGWISRLSQQRV